MYTELKRRILEFDNGLWPDDMKRIIKEIENKDFKHVMDEAYEAYSSSTTHENWVRYRKAQNNHLKRNDDE